MRNIWRIFRADWQRISASVVAVVVIMGLCLIPCLYAWFNIFSNWDPYGPDATSNIRVAVTSEDEGYELLGLKLNIGSMVLDGLKSNNQMGWDFVDSREEALEGVRSGRYYAALIVPADFTGDFVSILDTDLRHPQIEYYENEKKNAIAPKITNKAKTAVQDEINATVVETVTNAVTTVSSVCRALGLDADDVSQGVIEKLSSAQDSLRTLEETLTAMQTLADQTDSILACAGVVTGDLDSIVSGNDLSGIQDALDRGIGRLNETEAEIARQLEDIDAQIDVIADDIAAAVGTAEDVAGPAQQLDQRLAEQQQRLEKLRDFAAGYPAVQERLGNAIYRIGELRDLLKTLEDPGQLETWRQEVQAKVDALRQELREAALRISGSVNQRLEELNRDVTEKLQTLQSVFDSVSGNLSALGDKLTRYQEAIQSTGTTLSGAIQLSSTLRGDLGQLAQDMDRIVTSDGFRRFVEVLENDPEGLADYLSDPVSMETVPVYEITSYGSSMAPYYIMLALFVGSLLTATMLHVNAPMPGLSRLRPWQRFFGRYQLFFLIGMIQALVTGLGCIYYIGIQCPYPGLFLLACCVCSLNFTMMNYALVYALDNIGMAASVIIMVIQVAGSGGVYPIDVLPGIFQTLYKFMPFHYGMDMLRETIAGRYENVYWKNLAVMAAMCVLFAVLGMVLYYPARPLNRLIARSKEKSGIMQGGLLPMNAKHDLAEALCQLLETKTLEKITVKDIVARCGVNRQTFYYHFHDVYDLMRWIFDREAAALAQSIRSNGSDWRQELRTITDVLRSKRHLVMNAYRSVNRRDLERYLMQGYGPVIRRIVDQAAVGLDVTQGDLEFVSRFYARGLLSGVFDWIESGMPENIGDDLRRCILLLDGSLPTALKSVSEK